MGKKSVRVALAAASVAMTTPAFADCLSMLREWQDEELAVPVKIRADKYCAAAYTAIHMAQHKAAYFRSCEPGLEGEQKAHKAEMGLNAYLMLKEQYCGPGGKELGVEGAGNKTLKEIFGN